MAERQGRFLGDQVSEVTIFIGPGKDTGLRELFVSLKAAGRQRQTRLSFDDWLDLNLVVARVGRCIIGVECGTMGLNDFPAELKQGIEVLQEAPF